MRQTKNGTGFGNILSFRPPATIAPIQFNETIDYGSLIDQEGNIYKTVVIGNQTWIAENLKTTKLRNGTNIPLVKDGNQWSKLVTPAYCWYDNDPTYFKEVFGALYNWYAVSTNKLCPAGWHVATQNDWSVLYDFLGGYEIAGGKLKEAGTSHWIRPNIGATNETGFTALTSGN